MHDSSRALLKRGSIAAATTALVIGSSFAAAPAIATATPEPAPSESSAAPTTEASDESGKAALPSGLEEAVERDLGKSLAEFYSNGELNSIADALSKELEQSKLEADFAIAGNKLNVTVSASALKAVTERLDELTKSTDVDLDILVAPEEEFEATETSVPEEAKNGGERPSGPKKQSSSAAKTSTAEAPKLKMKAARPAEHKPKPKSAEALLQEFVANVEPEAVSQLQSVMKTGTNTFVIRTGGPAKTEDAKSKATPSTSNLRSGQKLTPGEFAEQYTKVTIEKAEGPAKSAASNDVLGGMGYAGPNSAGQGYMCSLGFNGFTASGKEAIISAGHCAQDGDLSDLFVMEHAKPNDVDATVGAPLGTFGFSQFGGPGNSRIPGWTNKLPKKDYTNVGTDISVIDGINSDLNLKPQVTDWKTKDQRGSGPKVTGVARAIDGTDICKSGRTTGWTCGTVDEVGIFVVGGFKGADDEGHPDVRGVKGFGMPNPGLKKANEGDSGGSVIAGGTAVGVTSAISKSEDRAYFTDIKDGLAHTNGYSIAIFLNAPAVAKGLEVEQEATISGTVSTAPAGSTVKVVSGGKTVANAKVASGKFSFKAPAEEGKFDFTLQTINGYNKSEISKGSVDVVKAALAVPAITTPKNDAVLNAPISSISGTGVAGATVTLTGDAAGTAKVGTDGKWNVKLDEALSYGEYSVSATQAKEGQTSKAAKSSFKIKLNAPAITTPADGKTFTAVQDKIAGTGVAGATVKLTGAVTQEVTVGDNGAWSVTLDDALSYGPHSITAVQSVGKTTSTSVKSAFKVVPAAPSIDSPTDGQKFAFDKAPKTVSGFGINGATIKVSIGDTDLTADVSDDAWTVMVPKDLKSGDHKVTAVQVIDDVSSATVSVNFTIAAAPKPEPTESTPEPTKSSEPTESTPEPTVKPSQDSDPSKAPVVPQGNDNDDDNDGLANTGPNAALPFIAGGGALLVAGGAFMLFRRKNTKGHYGA